MAPQHRRDEPTIDSDFLDREQGADPTYYASEYLAESTAGLGAVFPDDLVRAAVYQGEPALGDRFGVGVDASSGTGRDTFAMLLGNVRGDDLVVRDVRGWRGSPQDPVSQRHGRDRHGRQPPPVGRGHRPVG